MKILIVDDESLARDILKSQLNKFHYQDILTAENGQDALALLEKELPDVIFLDICMPEMSGIEFMEKANTLRKQIVFIILSGYNLFEYAQRTMELGAYNYLLKPIDDKKLKEAMDAVEEKFEIIKFNKEKYNALNQSRVKAGNLLKRQYIYEIISGNGTNSEKYGNAFLEEPVQLDKAVLQICCFTIRNRVNQEIDREDQEIIQFGIENITKEIAKTYGMEAYFFSDQNINGILMNYEQTNKKDKIIYGQIFDNIQKYISFFKQSELTFGVGKEVFEVEKLQEAYTSAKDTVNKRLILGGGIIFFAFEEGQAIARKSRDSERIPEESIVKSMYQSDVVQIKKYVNELYAPFVNSLLPDVKKLNKINLNLFVLLHKELEKREINSSEVLDNEFSLYNKIQTFDTIEEMKDFLIENILRCMNALEQQIGIGNEKIIIRAKEYISQNIGYHLTLESVAEHVNFSPAYFSKFFKNEEGLNFIDYVNKVRIEEAKELLNKNVKTADICDKIGFSDVKHFYKIFKRWEGITPGQYKKGL